MKTGIIFDMDGTLWDSSRELAFAWNQVITKRGREPLTQQDLAGVLGLPMARLARVLFPDMEAQEAYDLLDACVAVESGYLASHGARLYPGVEETLRALGREYPLFIVSNCRSGYIETFLDYYKFAPLFSDFECLGRNKKKKAENIRIVSERNGLERAIYIGDLESDYRATVAAGSLFVHAAYGFGTLPEEIAEKVPAVHSFFELPAAVSRLC